MDERILNLLRLCMQLKQQGYDYCFENTSCVNYGAVEIWIYKDGYKEGKKADKMRINMDEAKSVWFVENEYTIEEAEKYLKGLIECTSQTI